MQLFNSLVRLRLKSGKGNFSQLLTGGFMTFFDMIRNAMLAGLGIQQTVKEFVDELVKKGELSESEAAKLLKEWAEKTGKSSELLSKTISELVAKAMEKMNVPTKKDLEDLEREVRELSGRVEKLEKKP